MSIMDTLFGKPVPVTSGVPSNSSVPPVAQVATQVVPPVSGQVDSNGNPVVAVVKEPDSPLDKFTALWQNPVDAEGKPIQPAANPLDSPIFNFDPAKIKEQAKGLDFVKDLNPELVAKVASGGQDGVAALLELLNTVQQNSFAAATLSMGQMVNAATATNNQRFKGSLPQTLREVQLADTPVGDNPVLNHPAVQPLVHALRVTAFNKAGPGANPATISAQVNDFILGLATAMKETTPEVLDAKRTAAAKETNWTGFFGS